MRRRSAKLIKNFIVCGLLLALGSGNVSAQFLPVKNYPQNYFVWPIQATKQIVANFGELRNNHYHMGLDCRSEQAVNKNVVAAAEGYIAKVKVEPWGFGQAIYINHPNGMTTLYAHLNSFYNELDDYVKAEQYRQQSWAVYLDLPPNKFKVKQGQFIAKSGSTGGSMGPHLHFEVRDTKTDKVLNPLLMNFPIPDRVPPRVLRIAVYDRCLSTYEQTPKIYSLAYSNGTYAPAGGVINVNTEKVSFAITAYDQYTGSTNNNGIYQAILYKNDKPISGFQLDSIGYDETRYLNANIDYKTRANGGSWLQHLSKLPGYNTGVYKTDESNGVVSLSAGETADLKIEVGDPNGNTSRIAFKVKLGTIIETNTNDVTDKAKTFHPGFINIFETKDVRFYLPEMALYDSFSFRYKVLEGVAGNNKYQLHTPIVPVQTYFPVSIKGNFSMADTGKIVMLRSYGAKKDFYKALYNDGWYTASFREFGYFQLLKDDTPPVVTPRGFYNGINASKLRSITFSVTDDSEDLESFNAYLDGEWLRFSNDKGVNYIYTFDEKCSSGSHELEIVAVDMVGNTTTKKYSFTR